MSNQPTKGELKNLAGLGRYLRPYRAQIALAMVAVALTAAAVLGMGGGLRYLVDQGLGQNDLYLLNRAYALLLGVVLMLAGASYLRYFLVSWIGERVVADIRRDVFSKLVGMHVAFFEATRTGELLSRLTTDSTLLQTVVGSTVSVALRNILLFFGGVSLLLITSAKLTGYVFLILPLVVAPILLLGRKVRVLSRETQSKVAELNAHAEETFSGIRTVQAMTMERWERGRFDRMVWEAMRAALGRIRQRALLNALVIALVFGAVVTVLWVGGHDVMRGRITPGELSAFVFYAVVVAGSVGALSDVIADVQRAAGATERLAELLALEPEIHAPAHPHPVPQGRAQLRFEQVSFHYPGRPERAALEAISLSVDPGEVVAVVGPSGAGKTTLFQLLLRFYDPQQGRVLFNGADIRDFDQAAYRARIGLVPQEPVIFSADAMTNIRAARPEASDEEVRVAAEVAGALEFIERLPQGFHTFLGEKGVRLSGGQRQRIAIARAVIRDPSLLLLDEATSSLDAESEHFVRQALSRLMVDRTTLIIAHRLGTVMNAGRIVLLNDGRIEAAGTHRDLMQQSPLYARLAKLQFIQENEAAAV